MKICVLVENHYRGGLSYVTTRLLSDWVAHGYEVMLLTNRGNPMTDSLGENSKGYSTEYFDFMSTRFPGLLYKPYISGMFLAICVKGCMKVVKLLSYRKQYRFFQAVFSETDYDVLINVNGGYPGSFTSRTAAISFSKRNPEKKNVLAIHNYASKSKPGFRLVDDFFDRKVIGAIDVIVTVSNSCRGSFANRKHLLSAKKIHVIPNGVDGIDKSVVSRQETAIDLGLPDNSFVYFMPGSFEARKGHEFLIKAFSNVVKQRPNSFLVFIGDDPENYKSKIINSKSYIDISQNLRVLPYSPDISNLYELCDVVVIPSQSFESFCIVAVEAFKHGKPIIGTNVGAIPETAPHGICSLLFDADDVSGFTNGLIQIAKDVGLRERLASGSHERFNNYKLETMLQRYRQVLLEG